MGIRLKSKGKGTSQKEDHIEANISLQGEDEEVKFNLTMKGEESKINAHMKALSIEGYGSPVEITFNKIQRGLDEFEDKKTEQEEIKHENFSE